MKRVTVTANRLDKTGVPLKVPVEATILSSITKQVLLEITAWASVLKHHEEEDASWSWADLVRKYKSLQRGGIGLYEYGVLRCQGRTQAVMILETAHHWSREGNKNLVYVEYLAVAPWNRPGIQHPREFSGCGRTLIKYASERSTFFGYGGLIALHTLPGARLFYLGMGFKDFGGDPQEDGLHYLELDD